MKNAKKNCDILIIGASPAGGVCAFTARVNNPDKKIIVLRENEEQLVPCSIPYVFGNTLGRVENALAPCGLPSNMDINNKIAYYNESAVSFDKLVFVTGSVPFVHESL